MSLQAFDAQKDANLSLVQHGFSQPPPQIPVATNQSWLLLHSCLQSVEGRLPFLKCMNIPRAGIKFSWHGIHFCPK